MGDEDPLQLLAEAQDNIALAREQLDDANARYDLQKRINELDGDKAYIEGLEG